MSTLDVQRLDDKSARQLPLFQAVEKQLDAVRRRAFGIFEKRKRGFGCAFEDWLQAEREVMGWPAAELSETDSQYKLCVTLPGYEPKDIAVSVTPSAIVVHATVETEKKAGDLKRLWTEFKSNDVYRRFELPQAIDVDKTTATLDKGMLHILAAKAAKVERKPIAVRAA